MSFLNHGVRLLECEFRTHQFVAPEIQQAIARCINGMGKGPAILCLGGSQFYLALPNLDMVRALLRERTDWQ